MITVSPKQLEKFLSKAIPAHYPVLITGSPGIGKSDLVHKASMACDADLIISHPVVNDPTDAKGLPWPERENGSARFLPYGDLKQAIHANKLTVWFLDDLGQALPAVQASYMQLILARRIGDHVLPDCVTFVGATNLRTDRAGVQGILEPVKSRFVSILQLQTSLNDWIDWALLNGIKPEVVAFLRFRPDLLHDFNPTVDMSNSPCPRTWHSLNKLLTLDLPSELELPTYAGAIGEGTAGEFLAFLRIVQKMPDIEEIIKNPDKAPIPKELSILYALSTSLAYRANQKNIEPIIRYAMRLHGKDTGTEFAVLIVRDIYKKSEHLIKAGSIITLINKSGLGKVILGED